MDAAESPSGNVDPTAPVLHVLVIGFHHKKGCQVEYAYPPLIPGGNSTSSELPSQWKHLPSLALPDGSHNFDSDTAYFHLPDLENPRKTIFGISCYRQIAASKVVNKTEETQRGVQKSVCALSRLPLYGHIQVKMSLITEAYFCEGDFTRLDLIHQTYDNLNACLSDNMLSTQQLYVGLSARSFLQKFHQRALVLFKLLLLEKRVLFFRSPVEDLSSTLLTLLSLHPGMLERGLDTSACIVPVDTPPGVSPAQCAEEDDLDNRPPSVASISSVNSTSSGIRTRISGAIHHYITGSKSEQQIDPSNSEDGLEEGLEVEAPNPSSVANTSNEDLSLPLKVFTGGNLCHPYLSLSYMDALTQPSITGYVIGATNVLFKQKKGIADVIVDLEKDRIDIFDPELKKALHLTTEDLRFVDNLVRHVTSSPTASERSPHSNGDGHSNKKHDVFLDGVNWEGGDGWCRAQFRFYLLCLLRTSLLTSAEVGSQPDSTNVAVNHFNANFVHTWMQTHSYQEWISDRKGSSLLSELLSPGHPYSGGLSVSDMKLHLSHTIGNSEGGKRVTQAVVSTSKVLAGGISTAKGALSSWITSFRHPQPQQDDGIDQPVHPNVIENQQVAT